MSGSQWRRLLMSGWVTLVCVVFVAIDNREVRSWLLLAIFGLIPPGMLVWLWNEDRPLPLTSLRMRRKP